MRYFLRKFGFFVATMWAAITMNFLIPRLEPGDPAEIMVKQLAGKDAELDPAKVAAMRAMLGVPHGSMIHQYWDYLVQLAHGNLGVSYVFYPFNVTTVIGRALPWTLLLVGSVQVLSFAIGTIVGAFAAWRRNSRFDSIVTLSSTFIGQLPSFWLALLLQLFVAYALGWLPATQGYESSTPGWNMAFVVDALRHTILPALAMLIVYPIGWILGMRNTMVMNLGEDYIRLARAKGVPDWQIALRYAARNSMLPQITGFAMALGSVFGGAMLVETTFDYPGLGKLMATAVGQKDYPLLQGLLLLTISATLIANFIADMLYGILDPRARKASS